MKIQKAFHVEIFEALSDFFSPGEGLDFNQVSRTDLEAGFIIMSLYESWRRVRSPATSDEDREHEADAIYNVFDFIPKKGKLDKDAHIQWLDSLFTERGYFTDYKRMVKTGISEAYAKEQTIFRIVTDFENNVVLIFDLHPNFEERLRDRDWKTIRGGFNTWLIETVFGHSPGYLKVRKHRHKERYT